MKEFFTDIFQYHQHFNRQLIDQLIENKDALPPATLPLFCHLLNAHQIWNARITGEKEFGVHDTYSLEDCLRITHQNHHRTLDIISANDFDRKIKYRNSKGMEFTNSIGEILFHISNHSTHHRGQVIADLRKSGITPITTDYIFYKR
ncbi:DinB family protein [Salinimicrobium sp. HB62]|uniref:DinB family protein n=1 Tax=Salinimicrobium sp. HB62 TaxID=3077781 RepID=UPI002D779EF3|nr:DinB family protein [Salinimicrobium sp. HB62]